MRHPFFVAFALIASIALSAPPASADDELMAEDTRSISRQCLEKIASGDNRFEAKIPLRALKQLADGFKRWKKLASNERYALLVDYSRSSADKRAFLIDFDECDVVAEEYVIHGGTVYTPKVIHYGDTNQDGVLDYCVHSNGSRKYMTRPGMYVTRGCHKTELSGWPDIYGSCQGIKIVGLEKTNADAFDAGVVLHEHVAIPNHPWKKPEGQGCPGFPKGKLSPMVPYGITKGTLVLLYTPQCD